MSGERTVGDVIERSVLNSFWWMQGGEGNCPSEPTTGEAQVSFDICTALGLAPSTPLANVVVLQPGQHVVEQRPVREGETFIVDYQGKLAVFTAGYADRNGVRWVVVRSAVTS